MVERKRSGGTDTLVGVSPKVLEFVVVIVVCYPFLVLVLPPPSLA